jgi:hypothetical protein
MIRRVKGGYAVFSHHGKRLTGDAPLTRGEATNRLMQIDHYKANKRRTYRVKKYGASR